MDSNGKRIISREDTSLQIYLLILLSTSFSQFREESVHRFLSAAYNGASEIELRQPQEDGIT